MLELASGRKLTAYKEGVGCLPFLLPPPFLFGNLFSFYFNLMPQIPVSGRNIWLNRDFYNEEKFCIKVQQNEDQELLSSAHCCEPNRPNRPSLRKKPLNLLLYVGEKVFFSTLWLPAQGTGTICSCMAVRSEERPNGLEEM